MQGEDAVRPDAGIIAWLKKDDAGCSDVEELNAAVPFCRSGTCRVL
jgi:hypothetical protein